MLNFARFLRVLTIICVGVFGAFRIAPAAACTVDEITLSNGNCETAKFFMDIEIPDDNTKFLFYIAAKGTFYIDWGDGSTTETVTRTGASRSQVDHKYSYDGEYTIRIGGVATEYQNSNTSYGVSPISLYGGYATPDYLVGIRGSLGALFPTLGTGNRYQPVFYATFRGCTALKGPIPAELFSGISGAANSYMFREMFYGCTNLDGYIPYNLFDGITGITSSHMTDIFKNDTKLATTCPTGTTVYTTGYENYWKPGTSGTSATPRVACKPDEVACDHAYNGACPDLCSWATQLKTSTGLSFPLYATKVTTVAINVRQNGITCYVPLESGNGGTGSLNLTYNGNTYHAGVIDTN
ncbi:MAG: hypothetical protein IJQ90_02500 [Alphaproteobacteria bacterium]|nr:hypothetical protein [Alphaproteobacteria bacterium]